MASFTNLSVAVLGTYTYTTTIVSAANTFFTQTTQTISSTFMAIQLPSGAILNTNVAITITAQVGNGITSNLEVIVTVKKGATVFTPVSIRFGDNGIATTMFTPLSSGLYTVSAVASGLPLTSESISVSSGPATGIIVASLPQATGFSLKDKIVFGLAATDATGSVAVVAMGGISIVIASGPTGAALMGVDALFLVAGRVSTTDLQVTLIGAYTFTICLIGTPKPACTTASVNVFLPEVKMVAANRGTFSGCLALSRDPSVVAVFVVERQEGRRPRHRRQLTVHLDRLIVHI